MDANRELFAAELALSQVQRDSLVSVVQLYRAFGGRVVNRRRRRTRRRRCVHRAGRMPSISARHGSSHRA
ncbi:MAG: hypothetical protein ACREX9_02700 [Gammaproteobacteria bacterium]